LLESIFLLYEKAAILYRAFGLILFCIIWVLPDDSFIGILLLLSLVVLMLIRWRLPKFGWTVVLDQLLVIGISFYWDKGYFALTLGVFDAVYAGTPILALPSAVYALLYNTDTTIQIILAQSAFAGIALWGWRSQRETAQKSMDKMRIKYYESEDSNQELLAENAHIARMVELSERNRIAGEIHDNAGHDIVAAYITLQTIETLYETDCGEAKELLGKALIRLESGIEKIRNAAHNLTTCTMTGIEGLHRLCDEFTQCRIEFKAYGDSSTVSVYIWLLLENCLRESLTNVRRHSESTYVSVNLDVTQHIVRMCVENDGAIKKNNYIGIGLHNMQRRARSVGGNVSVDFSDSFRLICVLPINWEDNRFENIDS